MSCCVLLSIPSFASQSAKACSPAGVWFGGSDYKYMMTVRPVTGDKFAIRYEADFANNAFGYMAWTSWSGELKRQNNGRYIAQIISMYTTSTELPPPDSSYELDAVRESLELTDCDNIKATIYFFSGYLDLNKV